jgi:hypothetical protein
VAGGTPHHHGNTASYNNVMDLHSRAFSLPALTQGRGGQPNPIVFVNGGLSRNTSPSETLDGRTNPGFMHDVSGSVIASPHTNTAPSIMSSIIQARDFSTVRRKSAVFEAPQGHF